MVKARTNILRLFAAIFMIAGIGFSAAALPSSYYKANSRLAQGQWVKVKVDSTGVYALSAERLAQLGFSDPSKVHVFGSGAVIAASHDFSAPYEDDLPLAPAVFDEATGKLIFYAEGDTRAVPTGAKTFLFTRSFADFDSFYFLSDIPIEESNFSTHPFSGEPNVENAIDFSLAISHIENECTNIGEGGAHFFDQPINPGTARKFVFDIEDMCANASGDDNAYFSISYVGDARVTPSILLDPMWTTSEVVISRTATPNDNTLLTSATSHLKFRTDEPTRWFTPELDLPANFGGSFFAPNSAYVIFNRKNVIASHPWRVFNFVGLNQGSLVKFIDAPQNLQIWNVSNPLKPIIIQSVNVDGNAYATINVNAQSPNTARYLAFAPSSNLPEPEIVGNVPNQDLHADKTAPEMIVIATRTLLDKAQDLAEYHRTSRGLDVKVVCQDLIFNEFSSGSRLPQGIRRYIKMLADNDADSRLKYILLYGPSVNDNRFIQHAWRDAIPTYENEVLAECLANTTNYGSDTYFALLDDSYDHINIYRQPANLSVGRIPANSVAQAETANAKIRHYFENPLPADMAVKMFFVSDHGNDNKHYQHTETARQFIRERHAPVVTSFMSNIAFRDTKHMNDIGRRAIRDAFMDGTAVLWYAGHGSHSNFLSNMAWTTSDVITTPNHYLPFGFLATCEVYQFDTAPSNIVETMVLARRGGMIGCISSGRTVYMQYNSHLNASMGQQVALAKPGDTFADIFRAARNVNLDVDKASCINMMAYNYCGDPSIPFPVISHDIIITEVNGNPVAEGTTPTVDTADGLSFNAKVVDADGALVPFNGVASVLVYYPVTTESYIGALGKDDIEETFTYEDRLLAQYPLVFANGFAQASLPLPATDVQSDNYRLIVALRDEQSLQLAAGHSLLAINEGDATPVQGSVQISNIYINSPENTEGAYVSGSLKVFAIANSDGAPIITLSGSTVGKPKCKIDGSIDLSHNIAATYDPDGNVVFAVALPLLPAGRHTAEISVADTHGNRDSQSITFTIEEEIVSANLAISSDDSVIRSAVEFDATDIPERTSVQSLVISDHAGNIVRSVANPSLPYQWNLTDANGEIVSDGSYNAHIKLLRDNVHGASPKISFVVIK